LHSYFYFCFRFEVSVRVGRHNFFGPVAFWLWVWRHMPLPKPWPSPACFLTCLRRISHFKQAHGRPRRGPGFLQILNPPPPYFRSIRVCTTRARTHILFVHAYICAIQIGSQNYKWMSKHAGGGQRMWRLGSLMGVSVCQVGLCAAIYIGVSNSRSVFS
jgi:hypothetical protein